jgi:thiol-disulfide isomerase/thioredoxin
MSKPLARALVLAAVLLAASACQRAPAPGSASPAKATPTAAAPAAPLAPSAAAPLLAIGRAFPAFMIDFLAKGGARHAIEGKLVVLNIWASWCPPCRREMPGLNQLARKLDPKRFVVIGLSTDDDAKAAQAMLTQDGIGFANFLDQGGDMTRRLGTDAYPDTFIIGANGVLLERMSGFHEWNDAAMVARLEQLYALQQQPAPVQGQGFAL